MHCQAPLHRPAVAPALDRALWAFGETDDRTFLPRASASRYGRALFMRRQAPAIRLVALLLWIATLVAAGGLRRHPAL